MSIAIRHETAGDFKAIRRVNYLAFGQDSEAWLVYALRDGGYVRVSLVADQAGHVVGHILFSDLSISTNAGEVAALALVPLGVLPDLRHQGIGSALVRRGLSVCKEQGHRIIVALGRPQFYLQFGFTAKEAAHLDSQFSGKLSFMALELVPGALDELKGRVQYPPPFQLWV